MRYVKDFTSFIIEANSGKRVAIFPGRFMPVHMGHITAFKNTQKEFGIPVIPIQIAKPGKNSPFPIELLEDIGKAVQAEYSSIIADWIILPQDVISFLPEMIKVVMQSGFDPVALGCGADRYKDYQKQAKYLLSPDSNIQINDFQIKTVMSRDEDGPSGTKIREILKEGRKDLFEKEVPKSVWPFYKSLKEYIK